MKFIVRPDSTRASISVMMEIDIHCEGKEAKKSSMNRNISAVDRLDAVAEELLGLSEILSIMRESAELQGMSSAYMLTLSKVTEHYSREVKEISKIIKLDEE